MQATGCQGKLARGLHRLDNGLGGRGRLVGRFEEGNGIHSGSLEDRLWLDLDPFAKAVWPNRRSWEGNGSSMEIVWLFELFLA